MTLTDLADRTGLAMRQLRYVVDEDLLLGTDRIRRGRGLARELSPADALGVACVAMLRAAGLRREIVRSCVPLVMQQVKDPGETDQGPIFLEIDERLQPRLVSGKDTPVSEPAGPVCLVGREKPLVRTRINLTALSDRLAS
jgi:hypothetical protein